MCTGVDFEHNLMVLMEQTLSSDHNVHNTKETARSKKRNQAAIATRAKEQGRSFAPMYLNPLKRSQLTLKFIRWLRHPSHRRKLNDAAGCRLIDPSLCCVLKNQT